jgi:hypothetical protein
MKSASRTKGRVEKPLTVRPALSRAAVQFVEKHPNEVTAIVANALEAAALEAGLLAAPERVLPEALRRLVVARQSDSGEGRVLSISEAAELLDVTRRGVLIPAEQIVAGGKVVAGIERVLAVIPDPEAAWDFLNEESAFVDSERSVRPIDALRQGKVDAVVAAAHSFLEAFS